jgi:anti-sigma B factor antagonist
MFDVELSVDSFGGHAIVALYGDLRVADAPDLASHLITAVATCGPSIIVDLAGLELIDACGLRVLVRVLKWTRESGGDMALASPQPQVRQVLSVTGLIDAFAVYPSVEQAATGQGGSRPRRRQCHSGQGRAAIGAELRGRPCRGTAQPATPSPGETGLRA